MNIKEYTALSSLQNNDIIMGILKQRYDDYSFLACKLGAENTNKSISYGGMALAIKSLIDDITNSDDILKKMKRNK